MLRYIALISPQPNFFISLSYHNINRKKKNLFCETRRICHNDNSNLYFHAISLVSAKFEDVVNADAGESPWLFECGKIIDWFMPTFDFQFHHEVYLFLDSTLMAGNNYYHRFNAWKRIRKN